jgi:hypothetical protein
VENPNDTLTADSIGLGSNNAILIGGADVSPEALERAREMKVKGIVVGGISSALQSVTPASDFPIVATEGYGSLPMAARAFDILRHLEGRQASISGHVGGISDGLRPEIIVPLSEDEQESLSEDASLEPARVDNRVRAVRQPLLGQVGEIVSF